MSPSSAVLLIYLVAFGAGLSAVFQTALNGNLRLEIGSPWWAGLISYVGGTTVMALMVLVMREPMLTGAEVQRSHVLSWTGGIFGAIYIAAAILLLPRLGAATLIGLVVAGQMFGSLAFDHFGLFGVPVHPLNALRLSGAALLIVGVVLIRI
jgi:transporter family-2 protein